MAKTGNYYRQRNKSGSDRAFMILGNQRIYLGNYDSPESWRAYHAIQAEYKATGLIALPGKSSQDFTICELFAAFLTHAEKYYRKPDGTPTSELKNFIIAMREVRPLYETLPADDFSPLKLQAVRQRFIDRRLARKTINDMISRIKLIFKWGLANELLKPETVTSLNSVAGLRRGRSGAKETKPVKPVTMGHVDKIKPFVSRQVWGLVQFQLFTGCRPTEATICRPVDIDMSGKIWIYTPQDHKNSYRGHDRQIFIGPRGQEIVKEFLQDRPIDAYLFSPKDAAREKAALANSHRRQNQTANPRKTSRVLGDSYGVDSYRRAIRSACLKAGIPIWSPNQLRHSAGTRVRKQFGVEGAQLILGHQRADVTQIYSEVNTEKALQIAQKIG
jgi:integrase